MKGRNWFYERGEGDTPRRPLTLRGLMTSELETLSTEHLVGDAIRLVVDRGIRHIPVVNASDGKLAGLVTESDLLRKVMHGRTMNPEEQYHAFLDAMLPIEDIMVRDVKTLAPEANIAEAVKLFLHDKIRCVLIVEAGGKLAGIVTESDLMKLLEHMVGD
jgi:CBS domain-containing protein